LTAAPLGISVSALYSGSATFNNSNATITLAGLLGADIPGSVTVVLISPNAIDNSTNYVATLSSSGFTASNYLINNSQNSTSSVGVNNGAVYSGIVISDPINSVLFRNVAGTNIATILQAPSNNLPTVDIATNKQISVFGGLNDGTPMIVADSRDLDQPDLLFPNKSSFIGDTRLVPFDNSKAKFLGVRVGTAYDNINPVEYKVISDFYDFEN
jgi:hypothetical protein